MARSPALGFAALTLSWVGCAAGTATPTASTGGASSSSGTTGSGVCLEAACGKTSDCCPGFACGVFGQCCETQYAINYNAFCQLDTDCCPTGDAGSGLPYCDTNSGQCSVAPNCVPLRNPCTTLNTCCPQPGEQVYCSPINGPVTAVNSGLCAFQLQGASSSTGGATSGGGGTGTSGDTGGTGDAGDASTSGTSTGGTGGSGTNYVFTWTFGVNQACERAGVSWVEIQLQGNTVGLYPCRAASGNEGATVAALPLQAETYALTGYDAAGDLALAQAAGTAPTADGPTPVAANLTFNAGGPSNLDLTWTFAGQSCTAAGVSDVQVTLTDPTNAALDVNETVPCSAAGHDGLVLTGYGAGQFPVSVAATGSDGGYQATASVSSNGLSNSVLQIDLLASSAAPTGSLHVHFDFGGESCVAAGLDGVSLELSTIRGTALVPGVMLGCDAGADYTFGSVPAPATPFLWVEGTFQGQVQQLANPQVVVSPGGTASYAIVTQLGN